MRAPGKHNRGPVRVRWSVNVSEQIGFGGETWGKNLPSEDGDRNEVGEGPSRQRQ